MFTRYKKETTIIGCDETLRKVDTQLSNLRDYKNLRKRRIDTPKGMLFIGQPGSGKTLFLNHIMEYPGIRKYMMRFETDEKRQVKAIKKIFKKAKRHRPSIIVFDELERLRGNKMEPWDEGKSLATFELLSQMDGVDDSNGVMVCASTCSKNSIDAALFRSGRFEFTYNLNSVSMETKKNLIELYSREDERITEDLSKFILELAKDMTPSDIKTVMKNIVSKEGEIKIDEIKEICECVMMGVSEDENNSLSEESRKQVAVHEAGHAIASIVLGLGVSDASIKKRGRMYGYVRRGDDERNVSREDEAFPDLVSTYAAYSAEKLLLGNATSGAVLDRKQAFDKAYKMVTQYGYSGTDYLLCQEGNDKPHSEDRYKKVDEEVDRLMKSAIEKANELVMEHKDKILLLSEKLLESESLCALEMGKILDMDVKYDPSRNAGITRRPMFPFDL